MAFQPIRDELVKIIKAVDGIGKVHDYRRHTTAWVEIYERHKTGGVINNWEITRTALGQDVGALQNLAGNEPFFHDNHSILILGHMTVNDDKATEKTFQDLIDAIVKAIRLDNRLNGSVLLPRSLQAPVINYSSFGGILVHNTELTYEAIRREGG